MYFSSTSHPLKLLVLKFILPDKKVPDMEVVILCLYLYHKYPEYPDILRYDETANNFERKKFSSKKLSRMLKCMDVKLILH